MQWVVHWGLEHRNLDGINALGLDEIAYRKGHKYMTENFRPAVAETAISCLESLSDPCDRCGLTQCGMKALESAEGAEDSACSDVEAGCEGMGELCERYSKGLNDVGRERFRKCLIDECGINVRFCLWDPSSTPCTEGGGGFVDFQF